jgi:hypothetical protein
MVLGVFLSTAVASLWSLEKPGREAGGLVGGEMWVNPREWALSVNCREGKAGVLPALSGISDVSCMSGRHEGQGIQCPTSCCLGMSFSLSSIAVRSPHYRSGGGLCFAGMVCTTPKLQLRESVYVTGEVTTTPT